MDDPGAWIFSIFIACLFAGLVGASLGKSFGIDIGLQRALENSTHTQRIQELDISMDAKVEALWDLKR